MDKAKFGAENFVSKTLIIFQKKITSRLAEEKLGCCTNRNPTHPLTITSEMHKPKVLKRYIWNARSSGRTSPGRKSTFFASAST